MVILMCPNCDGIVIEKLEVKKYYGKLVDFLHCKSCGKDFPIKDAGCRNERDMFSE